MVPIFCVTINFLTAMRIWFSLGTFVNLLETKADLNHAFPRARRSPPQTRSSSIDLPLGIFATMCSTKVLRSDRWAGNRSNESDFRMKQQTSLKPCIYHAKVLCLRSHLVVRHGSKHGRVRTLWKLLYLGCLKDIPNIFGIPLLICLNIDACWIIFFIPQLARPHPRSSQRRLRRHVQHLSVALGTFKWSWHNIIIFKVHTIYKWNGPPLATWSNGLQLVGPWRGVVYIYIDMHRLYVTVTKCRISEVPIWESRT